LCVKSVKALEAFGEDFLIAQALLSEAFKDLFDPETLQAMKRIVFQIRIMNEFR
jgi:hypothetical protein